MAWIKDEKEYIFEGKNFYGIIAEKEINIDGDKLTIPFYFNKKDDYYNTIADLKEGYSHTFHNRKYVLKKSEKEENLQDIFGRLSDTKLTPVYLITLSFKRN
ncbi:hypothetical protein [Lactiplantibacillus plantarum]|uniref:hypothetical protein n=1 Tax=Lactiplantibacillus plantarum TaxID=1590 RepID=UPI0009348D9A|nr:hypothetical protein [Lactiplantibacillus plantarum]